MRLVGIHRSPTFSPGRHAENDRLILEATVRALQRHGCTTQIICEDEVGSTPILASTVFSMCQGSRANRILEGLEREGALIINAPSAVQNCHRARLHRLVNQSSGSDHGVFAPVFLVSTDGFGDIPAGLSHESSLWVKRGDVHATQQGDVVRVYNSDEYRGVLREFRARGIVEAVVEPHLGGEVVKFYGVVDSPFFRFYGEKDHKICPDTFAAARPDIECVIRTLGLEIYGGDAVLTPEGRVLVIDINDWPSFANFRAEAGDVIGNHIFRRAVGHGVRSQRRQSSDAYV